MAPLTARHGGCHLRLCKQAPRSTLGAGYIRDLQICPCQGGLRRTFLPLFAFGRLAQIVQRAFHGRDHTRGNAGIARGRGQFGMAQERLYDPDIVTALKEVCRKAVPEGMQRNGLGDARGLRRLFEKSRNLARRQVLAGVPRKDHPVIARDTRILTGGAFLPSIA